MADESAVPAVPVVEDAEASSSDDDATEGAVGAADAGAGSESGGTQLSPWLRFHPLR